MLQPNFKILMYPWFHIDFALYLYHNKRGFKKFTRFSASVNHFSSTAVHCLDFDVNVIQTWITEDALTCASKKSELKNLIKQLMYLSPCIKTSLGESKPVYLYIYHFPWDCQNFLFRRCDWHMKFSMGIKHRIVKIASLLLLISSSSHPYDWVLLIW